MHRGLQVRGCGNMTPLILGDFDKIRLADAVRLVRMLVQVLEGGAVPVDANFVLEASGVKGVVLAVSVLVSVPADDGDALGAGVGGGEEWVVAGAEGVAGPFMAWGASIHAAGGYAFLVLRGRAGLVVVVKDGQAGGGVLADGVSD